MSDFSTTVLLDTSTVTVWDLECSGHGAHAEPAAGLDWPALIFPYRGLYVRAVDGDHVVAEAGQVLFHNPGEAPVFSHPLAGGDGSLWLRIAAEMLSEVVPESLRREGEPLRFRVPRLRIDPRAQVLVALLRHSLREGIAESLEAESLSLTLAHRALGPTTSHEAGASMGRRKLVDRAKIVLASDLSRRWSLAEIGAEVGVSPVYLTQVFQQVEGVPLYRYQLRLRLARALDLLSQYEDLSALSLELGFSSHSHFTAAFQQMYGRTPSEFRQFAVRR